MNFFNYIKEVDSQPERKLTDYIENGSPLRLPWLEAKVNKDGSFRSFYGDTTVISISEDEIKVIQNIQEKLLKNIGNIFGEKIKPSTFHITTHDLNNGNNKEEIEKKMRLTAPKVKTIFNELKKKHGGKTIKMVFTEIYHSVTSLCMGFVPQTEADFNILMDIDKSLEEVFPLNRILSPHITLFYYQLREFSLEENKKLIDTLKNQGNENIYIELHVDKLSYQHFESMNNYKDIFLLENC